MAAYAAGEKPILARGLDYSSEEVYTYVQRVVQHYGSELGLIRREHEPSEGGVVGGVYGGHRS
jgi:hypothetical protein